MTNFQLVSTPLVKRDVTILRDKDTKEYEFRLALRRISYALVNEISNDFEIDKFEVESPLEKTEGYRLKRQIVCVPVLRAGLSMVSAFIDMIPEAKMGHIGLERNDTTLEPVDYYFKTPKNLEISKVIILDPMLATGGSASAAVSFLQKRGAKDCILSCLIAAPEGVKRINQDHPDVKIYSASLDRQLNENGYILPGLGDAGDRTFGTL